MLDFMAGEGIGLLPISYFENILIAASFLYIGCSFLLILLINKRKRKRLNLKGWDSQSKQIIKRFFVLLVMGAILCYLCLDKGHIKLILPLSLLLYGIGCFISNKFTNGPSKLLGILMLFFGILLYSLPAFSFLIWGIAFGLLHILYGLYQPQNS